MPVPTRYRTIEVAGTPRELGRQIGEAARDEIRGFCAIAMENVNRTVAISRAAAMEVARGCIPPAEHYAPEMMDELRGMAEAAGVSLDEMMLLQVRNQLQPEGAEGCTALAFAGMGSASSAGLVAQNWDNDPALDPFTVVLTRRPAGKPALMTLTQAGLIGYVGFNEAGIGMCLNALPAPARRVGVPHYFALRAMLESESLETAVAAVRRAHRALPANVLLITPEGPADLEITIDEVHVLRPDRPAPLAHTNHCRHGALLPINDEFPELIQSHARQRRVDALLAARQDDLSVATVQDVLRDHQDYPRSICRHSTDDRPHGFWQTVFSVIVEPAARSMHVSRGTPCEHPYETYRMD